MNYIKHVYLYKLGRFEKKLKFAAIFWATVRDTEITEE